MVHSLCRAGTASAALLNGNQQANPASGSADDKGNSATDGVQRNLQKRTGDKQANERASALKKNVCPKIHRRKQDFTEQTLHVCPPS